MDDFPNPADVVEVQVVKSVTERMGWKSDRSMHFVRARISKRQSFLNFQKIKTAGYLSSAVRFTLAAHLSSL